jgi:hypothetical protein
MIRNQGVKRMSPGMAGWGAADEAAGGIELDHQRSRSIHEDDRMAP